ncbi:saccharopine dehydrogenase family protein [Reinekea blandensis]|uniref:Putative saccharopine dehydrogenase n=1 Tax=Reinekea blandensis MED297 TaxID=314283 RepID=A4B920_9GAMM|nr:saccharopine dehydrogenase NADP-binding domain-containing protein [Reinekea blandensis]EAR11121.1 putative saccharopine dehydrogenase [Reinekea sp. MED297] [Reinekea blandensis MED297]
MTVHYDIVLMGATSFVGQITARRFAQAKAAGTLTQRVAVAGRSADKLQQLVDSLKAVCSELDFEMLVVDALDSDDVQRLVKSTRVVISTVGPYDLYGDPLVAACAKHGTHYCDLTGEPQFYHRMLNAYEDQARASGACIVHCCGFDSVPSDMGVYFLQQRSLKAFGEPCVSVDMRVKAMRGSFSGGTIASLMNVVALVKANPSLKKILFNPYALCPETYVTRQRYIGKAMPDWISSGWVAPFVMAAINAKVVMRSAQLVPEFPKAEFTYNEGMIGGQGRKGRQRARMISAGLKGITVGAALAPTRWLLQKWLPKPGQGPSEQEQKDGFYVIHHYGETASGRKIRVSVTGDEDPGYGSTSKMLMQAALLLATDLPTSTPGGFWTPASLLGDRYLERLSNHAGLSFACSLDEERSRE